jgi:CDP-paratose 2-epimerase
VTATRARSILVTGGAGFIGTNVADRLAGAGHHVIVYDNLSREGVRANLAWLRERHGGRIDTIVADVRDRAALRRAVARAEHVFHFAAQVAVTTSLVDPIEDFEINALGTLNLLETIRECDPPPSLLYTSTNKVYGSLPDVALEEGPDGYAPADALLRRHGIDESRPLDFHSPYGCSKGCADQYVIDYARIYGLATAVFRMSCIYGPHQCGTADQGWVAHFLMSALMGRPITIYGDGLQVRDALYVDDLVDAMFLAQAQLASAPAEIAGRAFNIGGGPDNAVTVRDLLALITASTGRASPLHRGSWRPGDQRYYVSNIDRFYRLTGWRPRTSLPDGLTRMQRSFVDRHPHFGPTDPARREGTAAEGAGTP